MKNFLNILLALIFAISSNGVTFKNSEVGYYCDSYFFDTGTSYTEIEEVIEFDNYTVNSFYLDNGIPNYVNLTQLNSCAPMAGTIILSYFDYYYPNIVPNFATSYIYNDVFYYRAQNTTINQLKETIYDYMGTNSINPGTSIYQFKTGMTNYCTEQGYQIIYNNCNVSNISTLQEIFENNKPLAIFVNSYSYIPFGYYSINDTEMNLIKRDSNNGHVAVAYGYREYNFYNNNNVNFRTDKYLLISFGDGTQGMLCINNISKIDEALAITIS